MSSELIQQQDDPGLLCLAQSVKPVLEVVSASKSYGPLQALHEVSLAVQPGEILGLVGPNGAGKTTLLQIIAGLLRADTGSVRLFGQPARRDALDAVAYLPEERGIYTREKVGNVIRYFLEIKGCTRAEAHRAALESMKLLELTQFSDWRIERLSKGNQQRVQLAAAIAGRPRLVVLDEPTTGLDPVNHRFVAGIIQQLAESGCAVLLATHQMHLVESLCRRVLMVNRGRCVLNGEVQAIRAAHSNGVVKVRSNAPVGRCPMVSSAEPDADNLRCRLRAGATREQFLGWLVNSGVEVTFFEAAPATLEDVFVEIVNGSTS